MIKKNSFERKEWIIDERILPNRWDGKSGLENSLHYLSKNMHIATWKQEQVQSEDAVRRLRNMWKKLWEQKRRLTNAIGIYTFISDHYKYYNICLIRPRLMESDDKTMAHQREKTDRFSTDRRFDRSHDRDDSLSS